MKPSRFYEKFYNFLLLGVTWGMFFVLGTLPHEILDCINDVERTETYRSIILCCCLVCGMALVILGMVFNKKLVYRVKNEFQKEYQDMKEYIKTYPGIKHFTDGTIGIKYDGTNEDLISDFLIDVLEEDIQHDLEGNLYATIISDIKESEDKTMSFSAVKGLEIKSGDWVLKRPNNEFIVKQHSFVMKLTEVKE